MHPPMKTPITLSPSRIRFAAVMAARLAPPEKPAHATGHCFDCGHER